MQHGVANFAAISTTPAVNFPTGIAGVNDTVTDTSCNLPVSRTPGGKFAVANNENSISLLTP